MRQHLIALSCAVFAAMAVAGCDKVRQPVGPEGGSSACVGCHGGEGGDTSGAPPRALDRAQANPWAVGAHRAHLGKEVRCEDCHLVPSRIGADGHLTVLDAQSGRYVTDTGELAEVPFPATSRARLGGATPAWNRATGTCSGVYCHGATSAAPPAAPIWTGGAMTCSSCHASPPASHVGNPPLTACITCHPATVTAAGTIVPGGGHINGVIDFDATNACTTCHGTRDRVETLPLNKAAPPAGVVGSPNPVVAGNPTSGAVGAHQAHLHDGPLAKAFACAECHVVPKDMDHFNRTTPSRATLTWEPTGLASTGTASPSWSTGTGRCSGVYCHGATLSGGSNKTPLWAGGPAQVGGTGSTLAQRCNVCHGAPPAAPHPQADQAGAAFTAIGQCADCHPGTVDKAAGEINVAGGLHVNGTRELGNIHPANFATPTVHGPAALNRANGGLGFCKTCHGATFGGDSGVPSCNACHEAAGHATWLTECTFCHGNGARAGKGGFPVVGAPVAGKDVTADQAAPPVGTQGEQTGSQVAVGAHEAHLDAAGFSKQIACTECHGASLPTDATHADASVALGWGTLATRNGTVVPTPPAGGATLAWENNPNCTNYCHGATLAAGSKVNPSWVAAADGNCGTCHGMQPGTWHPANSTCADCHGNGYVSLASADPQRHVNGTVDVLGGTTSCTSCHGTAGANAAPPKATTGATSGTKVGAHQAHVTGTTRRAAALGCPDCHGTLPATLRHANGAVDLAWSTLARSAGATMAPAAGTLPADWETTPTCTNYCHGNTLGGGTRTTPAWGDSTATAAACTSCHGAPPPYSAAGNFHVENAACGGCHTGATATTLTAAARGLHINGTVDVASRTCTTCHSNGGATFTATDGSTAASGNRVGAHVAHLNAGALAGAYACADCHGAPPASTSHANGAVDVAWSALPSTGTTPSPAAGTVTTNSAVSCANYCHGATLSANFGGAASKSVSWTGGAAAAACGTCHFVVASTLPAAATHPRNDTLGAAITGAAQCGQCHPDTMSGATINVAGGRHINGVLDGGGAAHVVPYPPLQHSVAFEANQSACTGCHGANYDTLVGTPQKSCNTCHANPSAFGYTGVANAAWSTDCTFCHGNPARAADAAYATAGTPARNLVAVAPPEAVTDGVTSTTFVQVGAHQAHFTTTLTAKVQCTTCHGGPVPANLTHVNGAVALGWGTLATGGGTVVPTPAAFNAAWEASPNCTNYCHGATLAGGPNGTGLAWTAGPAAVFCGSCHATPLPYTAAGGFHVQNTACGSCHTGYTISSVAAATHINGTTNVVAMNCTSCHSLTASAGAPFSDTVGSTATNTNRAGAHTAHLVAGTLDTPLACSDCHGALPGTVIHANGVVNLAWNSLAATGTTPVPAAGTVPTAGTLSCANYCHGATLTAAEFGGSNKNPSWAGGAAQAACGTCHFSTTVPATSTRHPKNDAGGVAISALTQCVQCHPLTVTAAGAIDVAGGKHLNGVLDVSGHVSPYPAAQHSVAFEANQAGCQGCHGANYDTLVPTSGGSASCNTCHANPSAFNASGAYTGGVANASWSTDCTFCHGSAARAADAAYGTAGSPLRNLNQIAPPEAITDGVTSTTFVQVGAHQKHLTTTGAVKVQCTACHGTPPGSLAHVNGSVALAWSTLTSANAAVTPTPAAFNAAWEASPTCTNYCHGANLTGGTRTAPSWVEGATGAACGTCHFAAGTAATGTHAAHTNNAAVIGTNLACQDCHSTVVNATGALLAGASTLHVNGTDNVSMLARGAQSNGSYAAGGCAASYCHSSGQATPTYRSIAWTAGAIGCNGCHGTGNAAGAPDYASGAAGSATANTHAAHTGAGAASCQDCHSGFVTVAGTAIAGTSHVNGTRNVAFRSGLGAAATYNTASKTCSSVSCHGNGTPQWGGAALKCSDCHAAAGTGADVDSFAFGTAGVISTTEWTTSGHGQAAGALFTAATVLPTIAAGQPCLYCHDSSTAHDVTGNPFRLHGATIAGGTVVPGSFNAAGANSGNDVCLNCHGATGAGIAPNGQALRTATNKTSARHVGAKHGAGNDGGMRCWDCHDPHGDANIRMIGKKVARDANDASGFSATRVPATGTMSYTANTARANFVNASFTGICQACHTTALHFSQTLNEETTHNAGTVCLSCHTHEQPPTSAFGAGAPHASPYPAAQHSVDFEANQASCTSCHGVNFDTLVTTSGGSASCNTCHASPATFGYTGVANASWRTDCTFCHGSAATAADAAYATAGTPARNLNQIAPPEAVTDGVTSTTFVQVGAHQRHFTTTNAVKVQCTACHGATVPGDLTHVNGSIALGWSTLSTANAAVTPTPAAFNAAWASAPTCTNYCHGASLTGGSKTAPSWVEGATGAPCGACHFVANTAAPTATATENHFNHVNNAAVIGANFVCQDCHSTVVNATGALLAGASTLHVNGTDNVSMLPRGAQSNGSYVAGSCAASYCHSSGQATPTYRTIAWNSATDLGCNGCHGTGNAAGAPDYASGAAGSATANTHAVHTGAGAASCQDCHSGFVTVAGTAIAGTSHVNGTRNVAFRSGLGATATYNAAVGSKTCSNVSCHGSGTPQWGGAALKCSDCHAAAGTGADVDSFAFGTAGVISTSEWVTSGHGQPAAIAGGSQIAFGANALPTIAAGQPCLYCHDNAVTHDLATNPFRLRGASSGAGATFAAYNGGSASNGNEVCLNCHGTGSVGVNAASQGLRTSTLKIDSWHAGAKHTTDVGGRRCWDCHDPHGDGNIQMVGKRVVRTSADNSSFSATRVPATGTLSFTARATGTDFANASGTGVCNVCHTAGNVGHYTSTAGDGHNSGAVCTSCHTHDQPTANVAFAVPAGGGSCISCHTTGGPAVPGRRDVVAEFKQAWSHKASSSATPANRVVTDLDCAVCHMEGDPTTGATTSFHSGAPGGVINLRDPDTGLHIKGVTFTAASGTSPGFYTSTAVDLSFTQFRRNLASATLEPAVQAIMINQCLKCHDANGAAVTRIPAANGGSAEKPFGMTIAGAGYVGAGVTANGVQGGVTDINSAFATTNSSYHPVRGAQNNWYAKLTRMAAPWNGASRGASVNTTSWGPVISCWDCHAPSGTASTVVLTATVTAHGGATTLRGTPAVFGSISATNRATLCTTCHALYESGSQNHGANSAFTSSTDGGMTTYVQNACNYCHGSFISTTATAARPARGMDVHGVNALPTAGTKATRWAGTSTGTPAQVDARPYAFIRNTTTLANHNPAKIGGSTYSAACSTPATRFSSCSNGMGSYTVGGTY